MADYIPGREAELLTFAANFAAYVVAHKTALGFSAAEATALHDDGYVPYRDAYALSSNRETRTPGVIVDKSLKRDILKAMLRSYARRLQANPQVTAQQRADLHLPIRDTEPSPRPAPSTRPVGRVIGIVNFDVVTEWVDELSATRARPKGYAGYAVYSYVGHNPPADVELWRHELLATRARATLGFNEQDAGKPIHLRARFYSSKGEFGPLSETVQTVIAKVMPEAA